MLISYLVCGILLYPLKQTKTIIKKAVKAAMNKVMKCDFNLKFKKRQRRCFQPGYTFNSKKSCNRKQN